MGSLSWFERSYFCMKPAVEDACWAATVEAELLNSAS
jgi:hypothetical protein